MDELIEDEWYWVSGDGDGWWPAMYNIDAANGWTSGDTWEDFDDEVKMWQAIQEPRTI